MEQLLLATSDARAPLPNPLVELSTHGEVAVHVRFAEQARRFPERAAVVDERGTWTYRELEQRGNQLANYLRARGIRNQDIVAIDGARCASLVWAMLGVLKAGAAFVILDRSYPAPRLIDRLRIAQPRAYLLLDEAEEARLPLAESVEAALSGWRVTLSRCATGAIGDPLHEHSAQAPAIRVDPDDVAYLAFTSGSTGKPKGIVGTHRPLSHFLQWHIDTFALTKDDRFSMLSGLSHDPLLRDIFTPLWLGATLYVPDPRAFKIPAALAEWMGYRGITVAHVTPSLAQLFTEPVGGAPQAATEAVSAPRMSLRYCFFGGEVLRSSDVEKLRGVARRPRALTSMGQRRRLKPRAVLWSLAGNTPFRKAPRP